MSVVFAGSMPGHRELFTMFLPDREIIPFNCECLMTTVLRLAVNSFILCYNQRSKERLFSNTAGQSRELAAGHRSTMKVTVRLGEPITRVVGALRVELALPHKQTTVHDLLQTLGATYPGFDTAFSGEGVGHVNPYRVYVNARLVAPAARTEWQLQDGDKVYIFLPAAGGAPETALPRSFFARPSLTVARELLGQRLVRVIDGQRLGGRITEVEAYIGEGDQASHARRGPTPRNRSMYGAPGLAYVYLIYGMYCCLNVVTESEGYPAAILIRGLEPAEGVDAMAARRPGRARRDLANGPGKLCQALAIDRGLDGHDLTGGLALWIEADDPVGEDKVVATARINVSGDHQARAVPWRLVVAGL